MNMTAEYMKENTPPTAEKPIFKDCRVIDGHVARIIEYAEEEFNTEESEETKLHKLQGMRTATLLIYGRFSEAYEKIDAMIQIIINRP